MRQYHNPVLTQEVLFFFEKRKIKVFFDGTIGAGGHAKAILENHPEIEVYIGCDKDENALKISKKNLSSFGEKIKFIRGSFSNIDKYLEREKIIHVDGCLLDLGVSSMQLDTPNRGFSLKNEGLLDMRMNTSSFLSAKEVVNTFTEKELGRSILERMENIARIRIAMREKDVSRPIHIFGSLDMLSTPLYFIAGADIFDGLTWLRYGYVGGLSIYEQNFGLITALPLDSTDVYTRLKRVVSNLDELAKLRQKMANYLVDGDLKKLEQFESHTGLFSSALDALRSRLVNRGKEVI